MFLKYKNTLKSHGWGSCEARGKVEGFGPLLAVGCFFPAAGPRAIWCSSQQVLVNVLCLYVLNVLCLYVPLHLKLKKFDHKKRWSVHKVKVDPMNTLGGVLEWKTPKWRLRSKMADFLSVAGSRSKRLFCASWSTWYAYQILFAYDKVGGTAIFVALPWQRGKWNRKFFW